MAWEDVLGLADSISGQQFADQNYPIDRYEMQQRLMRKLRAPTEPYPQPSRAAPAAPRARQSQPVPQESGPKPMFPDSDPVSRSGPIQPMFPDSDPVPQRGIGSDYVASGGGMGGEPAPPVAPPQTPMATPAPSPDVPPARPSLSDTDPSAPVNALEDIPPASRQPFRGSVLGTAGALDQPDRPLTPQEVEARMAGPVLGQGERSPAQVERAGRLQEVREASTTASERRRQIEEQIKNLTPEDQQKQAALDRARQVQEENARRVAATMPKEQAERYLRQALYDPAPPLSENLKSAIKAETEAEKEYRKVAGAPVPTQTKLRNFLDQFSQMTVGMARSTAGGIAETAALLAPLSRDPDAAVPPEVIERAMKGAEHVIKDAFPGDEAKKEDLLSKLGAAGGSSAGFMLLGGLAKMLGAPTTAMNGVIAATGAASSGRDAVEKFDSTMKEYRSTLDDLLKSKSRTEFENSFGGSQKTLQQIFGEDEYKRIAAVVAAGNAAPAEAQAALVRQLQSARDGLDKTAMNRAIVFLANAGIGTSEALPIANAINRIEKLSGRSFSRILMAGGINSFEEAAQEFGQQVGGNIVERAIYDKAQEIFEGAGDAAKVAALVGLFQGGGIQALHEATTIGKGGGQNLPPPAGPAPEMPERSSPEEIDEFLSRARAKDSRQEIDDFIKAKEEREVAARPGLPAPAADGADAKSPPQSAQEAAPEAEPPPPPPAEVTAPDRAILRAYGYGDDDIDAMAPAQRASEIEEAKRAGVTAPAAEGTRKAPVEVKTAEDVEAAAQVADENHTPAQGEANNVQRGHAEWNGLGITIEAPAGGMRRGVAPDGTPFETKVGAAYGYLKGVPPGADGQAPDVFFGARPERDTVLVMDEKDRETGDFRQTKSFIGFNSKTEAIQAYLGTSSKTKDQIGGWRSYPVDEFKELAKSGGLAKPVAMLDQNGAKRAAITRTQRVAENEGSLLSSDRQKLLSLRRERDSGLSAVEGKLPSIPSGHGAPPVSKAYDRESGREEGVQPGELHLGHQGATISQPSRIRSPSDVQRENPNHRGVGERTQDTSSDFVQTFHGGVVNGKNAGSGANAGTSRGQYSPGISGTEHDASEVGQKSRSGTSYAKGASKAGVDIGTGANEPSGVEGKKYHAAIEYTIRSVGEDPKGIDKADLARAAEIAKNEGMPPDVAFVIATIRGAVESGDLSPQAIKDAVKDEHLAKTLLDARAGAGNQLRIEKGSTSPGGAVAAPEGPQHPSGGEAGGEARGRQEGAPTQAEGGKGGTEAGLPATTGRGTEATSGGATTGGAGQPAAESGQRQPGPRGEGAAPAGEHGAAEPAKNLTGKTTTIQPKGTKPPAKAARDWTEIGKNEIGQTLYEDQNGVRSYLENGARHTEAVPLRPTRAGVAVEKPVHKDEWLLATEKPKPAGAIDADVKSAFDDIFGAEEAEPEPKKAVIAEDKLKAAAKADGFDTSTDYWHGTTYGKFTTFKESKNDDDVLGPAVYLSKHKSGAEFYGPGRGGDLLGPFWVRGNIVQTDTKIPFQFDDAGNVKKMATAMQVLGWLRGQLVMGRREAWGKDLTAAAYTREFMKRRGVDGYDSGIGIEVAVYDPANVRAGFTLDEAKPAATKAERPAKEAAKSAAKNVAEGTIDAIDALGELFGGKNKLSMGVSFDEDTYAKAKPLFQSAAAKFAQAIKDVAEFARKLVGELRARGYGMDVLQKMRPYLERFVQEVKDGLVNLRDAVAPKAKQADNATQESADGSGSGQRSGLGQEGVVRTPQDNAGGEPAGDQRTGKLEAPSAENAGGPQVEGGGQGAGARPSGPLPEVTPPIRGGGDAANGRAGAGGTGVASEGAGRREPEPASIRPNYHLTDPERLVGGGPMARFARNREAIATFNALIDENRAPTPEELDTMASYTGWGSFGQELFQGTWDRPRPKDGWQAEDKWLRDNIGKDQWESAQSSIINAHYTDPPTVTAMWDMARAMGFKGGRVLEPSMGVGNFFGLMPRDLMAASDLTGIEMDKLTGGMAKILYPLANVQLKSYQESRTADNFYDLVIGNWPFAAQSPADRRYNHLSASLHDYFFVKALDQVRPGGIVMGITSAGTMDKVGKSVRLHLAKNAELVAAFRLPSGAFEKYAGTSVVTDLIILKKREKPEVTPSGESWLESLEQGDEGERFRVNEYYARANPNNILGKLGWGHGTTSGRPGMIVTRGNDFPQKLADLPNRVPKDAYDPIKRGSEPRFAPNNTKDRQGAVTVSGGKLYVVVGDRLAPLEDVKNYKTNNKAENTKRERQLHALVEMRRAYGRLIDAEREGDQKTEAFRNDLAKQYLAFVKANGTIGKSIGLNILQRVDDPFAPTLEALETQSGAPAKILSESTTRAKRRLDQPSVRDAFVLQRNESLNLDLDKVAEMAKRPVADVAKELLDSKAIYRTPGGGYEAADVFLSGNVRRKLRELHDAKENGEEGLDPSIDAVRNVIPPDMPYYKIEAKLGAPWVTNEDYRQFIADLLGVQPHADIEVDFRGARWKVRLPARLNQRPEAVTQWGHQDYRFDKLVTAAMGNQTVVIKTKDEDGNPIIDTTATKEANEKALRLREEFSNWIWKDTDRKVRLEKAYNEVMRAIATPHFDGSFLEFPGMALHRGESPFDLRKHQADAIWRGIVNRAGLYAHEVGTGKTLVIGGLAVESRRYGVARKPLVFAHNANSASVAAEIKQQYPGANVLYVDNLSPDTIDVTMRRIANDDWDAVIVPHSVINRFGLSEATLNAMMAEEIASLEQEAVEAANEDGSSLSVQDMEDEKAMKKVRSPTAKELVKQRNKIKEQIKKQAEQSSREGAIKFEDLGVDMIIVDESHEFKKPPISTKMRVKGLNTGTSDKSIALRFLTDYVKGINNGRGVHLFTGTPITNTLTEIYNMQRFVMSQEMARDGLKDWDAWFNAFADSDTDVELTSTGEYEPVTRLAAFVNVADLRQMVGQYLDIVFADDMPEFKPREINGKTAAAPDLTDAERDQLVNGRTEKPIGRPYKKIINDIGPLSHDQMRLLNQFAELAKEYKEDTPKGRKDRRLSGHPSSPIINDNNAAKTGLDARLFDKDVLDSPDSKANRVVKNVVKHYNEHPLATQVVFVEQGFNDTQMRSTGMKDADGKTIKRKVETFNLVDRMVTDLVEAGIPREQIAVVTGDVPKPKRKEIADAVSSAKLRVVIGNRSVLGVGVNMQPNLRAMHHMDAPWMPGMLEQANGRGWRQGNRWNTVLEYRYITDKLDGRRWQVLSKKDRFIKAFLTADEDVRVIDGDAVSMEESEGVSDIMATLSEAAGDPRILLRGKVQQQIRKLEGRERMHAHGVIDAKNKARALSSQVHDAEDRANKLQQDIGTFEGARADGKFTAVIDKQTYDDKEQADQALTNAIVAMGKGEGIRTLGTIQGFPLKADWPLLMDSPRYWLQAASGQYTVRPSVPSILSVLQGFPARLARLQTENADMIESAKRLRAAAEEPFQQADQLAAKKKQLAEIEADMARSPAVTPSWLRQGAPIDSNVWVRSGEGLEKRVVQGHRWGDTDYFVQTDKGEIPYLEALNDTGMRVYDPHPFTPPVKKENGAPQGAVSDSGPDIVAASVGQMAKTDDWWNLPVDQRPAFVNVYHGTNTSFKRFDIGKAKNSYERAIFFTDNPAEAGGYGARTVEAHLPTKLGTYLYVDRPMFDFFSKRGDVVKGLMVYAKGRSANYIIIDLPGSKGRTYIVMNPEVIRYGRSPDVVAGSQRSLADVALEAFARFMGGEKTEATRPVREASPAEEEADWGVKAANPQELAKVVAEMAPRSSQWVSVPEGQIYLRIGMRPEIGDTLEIPNIEFNEESRGKGAFKRYLPALEAAAAAKGLDAVYVEQLFNQRFAQFLRRNGYRSEPSPFGFAMSEQETLYKRVDDGKRFVPDEPVRLTSGRIPEEGVEKDAAYTLAGHDNNHAKSLREINELLGIIQRNGEPERLQRWEAVASLLRQWKAEGIGVAGSIKTEAELDYEDLLRRNSGGELIAGAASLDKLAAMRWMRQMIAASPVEGRYKTIMERAYVGLIDQAGRYTDANAKKITLGIIDTLASDLGLKRAEAVERILQIVEAAQKRAPDAVRAVMDEIHDWMAGPPKPTAEQAQAAEQKLTALMDEVVHEIRQIAGPSVGYRLFNSRFVDPVGGNVVGYGRDVGTKLAGFYTFFGRVIELALRGRNPISAARHEAHHHVENVLYNDNERAFAERETNARLRGVFQQVFTDRFGAEEAARLAKSMAGFEIRTHLFESYADARDRGESGDNFVAHVGMRRLFERIYRFLRKVRNWMAGHGYRTLEDIFEDAYQGKFANRAPRTGSWLNDLVEAEQKQKQAAEPQAQPEPAAATFTPTGATSLTAPSETISGRLMERNLPKLARVANAMGFNNPLINTVEARAKLQDKFIRWKKIEEAEARRTGTQVPTHLSPYIAEALYYGRVAEQIEQLDKDHIDPLIKDMARRKISLEDIGMFMMARHAPERNREVSAINADIEWPAGISDAEAAHLIDVVDRSGRRADYDAIEQRVRAIIDFTNDVRLAAGLMSQEQVDTWKAKYPLYVPLRGFAAADENEDLFEGSGKGFDIRGLSESRRALGRESLADNPIPYVLMQAQQAIVRAEKNRAGLVAYRFTKATPSELWEHDKGEPVRQINPATGLVEYRVKPNWINQDNVHAVKINGKPRYTRYNGPHGAKLARALKNLGTAEMNSVMRMFGSLLRLQARLYTGWSPDFVVSNFERDVGEAVINAQEFEQKRPGFNKRFRKHLIPAIGGSFQALTDRTGGEYAAAFRAFDKAGGRIRFFGMENPEDIKANIERKMRRLQGGALNKAKDAGTAVLDGIEIVNGSVENATRLAAFMAARDVGYSDTEAAYIARNLTVNFNKKGEWGAVLSASYMFITPALVGPVRMAQGLRNSKRVRRAAYGLAALGAMLTLYNIMAGGDDDDGENFYTKKVPPWVRDGNLIFMWPKGFGHDGQYVKWAIPFGFGSFAVAGSNLVAAMLGKMKPWEAMGAIASSILEAFDPLGRDQNWAAHPWPTLLRPPIHIITNKDQFGRPINPESTRFNRSEPDSALASRSASDASKAITDKLNSLTGGYKHEPGLIDVGPGTLDYLTRTITGGLGTFAQNLGTTAAGIYNGEEWKVDKTPFVRRMYGESKTDEANRALYFKQREEARAASDRLKRYSKEGDVAGIDRVMKDKGPESTSNKLFEATDRHRRALLKEIDELKANADISASERRQKIKALEKNEMGLMNETRKQARGLGAFQ